MSNKCKNVATLKRYWPGEAPDFVCTEHAAQSKRVAGAMGFRLVLEPITYPSDKPAPGEFPSCCCSVRVGK